MVGCGESSTASAPVTEETPVPTDVGELSAAIERNPDDAQAYYNRARYNYENANFADAVYDMSEAMKIDSVNEDFHILLAQIYLESYQSELALKTVDRALRLFPRSTKTRIKAAEMQIILRRYMEAAATLQSLLDEDPQNTEALQLLGILFKEQGDIEQAAKSFQTVVELDGDNYEAWTMLGNLLDIQGDPMALQCFENAIAIDSTYPQGWHSKAFYLQNHEQIDEAIAIYKKIHSIDPTYVDAYLNAAILHIEQSEYAEAEVELQGFIDISPHDPLGPYYMGVSSEQQGKNEEALGFYNQAASLSPRNARYGEAVERMRILLGK